MVNARNNTRLASLGLAALIASGCADRDTIPPTPATFVLRVFNRSQFDLLSITFEPSPELLAGAPLPVDAWVDGLYTEGQQVAARREKIQDGPVVEVRSREPPPVDAPGYALYVFDTSFRLMLPETVPEYPPPYAEPPGDDSGPTAEEPSLEE